jgi:hypothetical protein
VKASGNLANVSTGGAGFNNALLQTIAVSLSSAGVDVPAGANVVVQIAGRRTCANNGRGSGTVREWYNGQPVDTGSARDAGSRIRMTLGGVATDYFLRSAFALSTTAGTARESVDALLSGQTACPARPFTPLGTWSVILP